MGLIDKMVGHVFNTLHKSNDKSTASALKSIAKSGPAGKEAVKNAIELTQTVQRAGIAAAQNRADIRKKYNLKHV